MTDSNQNNGADRTANSSTTQDNADAPLDATRASSHAESKPPSVTEQVYSFLKHERVDRGYGNYQSSRHRTNGPLEQLLGPVEKEAKDAKFRKPDKSSKTQRTK
jgi:hypothetical protein